jgi:hypothetical protein
MVPLESAWKVHSKDHAVTALSSRRHTGQRSRDPRYTTIRDATATDYTARRLAEGKTKNEIMRCLKRYIAREIFHALHPPSRPTAEIVA